MMHRGTHYCVFVILENDMISQKYFLPHGMMAWNYRGANVDYSSKNIFQNNDEILVCKNEYHRYFN
jgi:hypothetical protein